MPLQSVPMNRHDRMRTALVLTVFTVVFTLLTICSYTQKSATTDEPVHLSKGYVALKLRDFRLHPENPPFLRIWAALPLMLMKEIELNTNSVHWVSDNQWGFGHEFLYEQNDADRLLYPARFMIVLLGILLGVLLFSWTYELFGFPAATIGLGLYSLEPNMIAHASLVTTDFGVTCFIFGCVYFLWRTTRQASIGNLFGMGVFFVLAQISKFSALLLGPITLVLLLIHICRCRPWSWNIRKPQQLRSPASKILAATAIMLGLIVGSYVAIWAVYGFRYSPATTQMEPFEFGTDPGVVKRAPRLAALVRGIDNHRLLPNAYTQGLLIEQARGRRWQAFLAGNLSTEGWWFYFPVAVLIKTPIALLLLFSGGLVLCGARRKLLLQNEIFALVPLAVGLMMSMTTHLNVGLRHVLPIYPFMLLFAGKAVAEIIDSKRKLLITALSAVCLYSAVELALVYPHCLSFFNQLVGGASNGHNWLLDSNLDWGQDLKGLQRWMQQNGVQHINLSYSGSADPAYYGINGTYLPGAPFFAQHLVGPPQLPGYVAISAHHLHGVPFDDVGRAFYAPLLTRDPDYVVGYSIHIYWVENKWW